MGREIASPSIISQRIDFISTKSMWFYIDILNEGLKTNKVESNGTIKVVINYNIDNEIIEKIREIYLSVGWKEVNITYTGNIESFYGSTIFEFIPPIKIVLDARKKINQHL